MGQRTIKVLFAVLGAALLVGVGVLVYFHLFMPNGIAALKIKFDKEYYLTEIRQNMFGSASVDSESYFKINSDQKTGFFYFKDTDETIHFIVTDYNEDRLDVEYIYGGDIIALYAAGTADQIRFKAKADYSVNITKENPTDLTTISYKSTILVFARGNND
jgi:hypothetical protein